MDVPIDKEVLLIDDCSTDGSREMIQKEIEGKYKNLKVIYHEKNEGKGSAIRTSLGRASGEFVIIQDADLEYDPRDYLRMCEAFNDPDVHVVYGARFQNMKPSTFFQRWFANRFLGKHYTIKQFQHFFGIQFLNLLTNLLYSANITDEATCYKAFRRETLQKIHLNCRGFEFCPEVTAKIRKAGYAIKEVPVAYEPRSQKEGKKLNWKHGLEAISVLIKYRFMD